MNNDFPQIRLNYNEEAKKGFTKLLHEFKMVNNESVGQVILHINNGGVTQISLNNWKVK